MWIVLYWVVKAGAWVGFAFSVFSVMKPDFMLKLTVRAVGWKLRLLGLEGDVRPAGNALALTRVWAAATAVVFGLLIYVFTEVIVIAHVLK